MKQIWITRTGPPEVLTLKEDRDPEPGARELRVRVKASGVNFADIMARTGVYPDAPKLPAVIGYEVSGEIDKIGSQVDHHKVGDKVIAICRFGGYSDTVVVPQSQVYALPKEMSFEQGAAMPVNYLTAYQALVVMGSLKADEWVLIHSIGGSVGFAAIDLCEIFGAKIIGTASASKHDMLRKRGVQHLIDYRTQDFEKEVKRITGGHGVHLILDAVGGDSWAKSFRSLAPTGRLVIFGASSLAKGKGKNWPEMLKVAFSIPWLTMNPLNLINQNKAILGVNLGHMWGEEQGIRTWGNQILQWYSEGKIHPQVDKSFPFDEAAAAHHYLQDRKNIGKVLLKPQ